MKHLKWIALLLAVMMTLSLCSCFLDDEEEPDTSESEPAVQQTEQPGTAAVSDGEIGYHDEDGYHIVDRGTLTYTTGYEEDRTEHSYDALQNDAQRALYPLILEDVHCFTDDVGLFVGEYAMRPLTIMGSQLSHKDIEAVLVAVIDDHPEVFWMTTDIKYVSEEDDATVIQLNAAFTAAQVVDMTRRLDTALQRFFDAFPSGLSAYEREEYIYRYIIDNCVYDEDIDTGDSYGDEHPAIFDLYGVMVDRKAVCEGYARTFDYLCSQVGVDTVCVGGVSDPDDAGTLHCWNAVQLKGKWYWADCTWDDWDSDEDTGEVFYYLNITDKILKADHTIDPVYAKITEDEYDELDSYVNSFVPPACTATEYCWYMRESVRLSAPDPAALSAGMVKAVQKGRKSLLVYVDSDAYTPQTMADALFDGDQPYYQAMDQANDTLEGHQISDENDASYETDEDRKLLIFELQYT